MPIAIRPALVAAVLLVLSARASAQQATVTLSEETEPRAVGGRGTTSIGLAGFIDRSFSAEEALPTTYVVQVDGARFVTDRFAVRLGVVGSGRLGGEGADDLPTGAAATAVHGLGGLQFHFTPKSIVSLYVGADYWMQLTQRAESERGALLGKAGIVGAISSRASFFVEGGYGFRLNRDDDDGLVTRATGQVGIRIKL